MEQFVYGWRRSILVTPEVTERITREDMPAWVEARSAKALLGLQQRVRHQAGIHLSIERLRQLLRKSGHFVFCSGNYQTPLARHGWKS